MILNNTDLIDYINNNPDTIMVRISPNIKSLENILWLCDRAKALSMSVVIQIIPKDYSNLLWTQLESIRFDINIDHRKYVQDLEDKGFVVYIPTFNNYVDLNSTFSGLDLGLDRKNTIKFKNCYNLLELSYLQFFKPFKYISLFAFDGLEGIFFWLMEKHVREIINPTCITQPFFVPNILRDELGLPKTDFNKTTIELIKNHVQYQINNIGRADLELNQLHNATKEVINGQSVEFEYFNISNSFGINSYSGFPLPENIVLYDIDYIGKWDSNFRIKDIVLKELN